MIVLRWFFLVLTLGSLPIAAMASDYGQGLPTPSEPLVLNNGNGENAHWSGIGRLYLPDRGQCIGSLIDTRSGEDEATGPAYVLTSGHCASKRNGLIVQDEPLVASIHFNFFADTPDRRPSFTVRRIVWSSVQGSDLALLELDASLAEVMAQDIQPLAIGSALEDGSAVLMVGEPTATDEGLKLSACSEHSLPWLMESPWLWRNLKRNDCQGAGKGASGSPILERSSNKVISVLNSEADDELVAIPAQRLLGCFEGGKANLDLPSCALTPGFQLTQTELETFKPLGRLQLDEQGQLSAPGWNFRFTLDKPRFRFKTVGDPLDCEMPTGYSGTEDTQVGLIDTPLEAQEGWQFLCVVGVESAEQLAMPGLMANALSIPMQLLPAGPVAAPVVAIERKANGDAIVTWTRNPPHITRYRAKRGAPETTDCTDMKGYGAVPHNQFVFKANKLPLKLCTVAIDGLRESSAPRTDLIPRLTD
jgi:hypothetical protein